MHDDLDPYSPSLPIGGIEQEADGWERRATKFTHSLGWSYARDEATEFVDMAGGEIEHVEPHARRGGGYSVTVYWRRREPGTGAVIRSTAKLGQALVPSKPRSIWVKRFAVGTFFTFIALGISAGWGPVGVLIFAVAGAVVVAGLVK